MASASRYQPPVKAILGVGALAFGIVITRSNIKDWLLGILTGPGSYSRIACIVLVLANIKNFPLAWHYRIFSAIFGHLEFANTPSFQTIVTPDKPYGPAALFEPVITSSYSPLTECDYNLHKSNSTYFSDLDVTRSHLFTCLARDGIKSLVADPTQLIGPDGQPSKGKWVIMLGAVQCSFKKEIKPYESYEMWSRILCWDRKWLYIVTHFVKKGAVRPDGYTLDDGSFMSRFTGPRAQESKKRMAVQNDSLRTSEVKIPHKAIFASAISKYVMKLGRLTIHPEVTLHQAGLLPPRPGGWNTMSQPHGARSGNEALEQEMHAVSDEAEHRWDWRRVEAENAKGMEYAKHFAALDGLIDTFTGEDRPALGVYRDMLW